MHWLVLFACTSRVLLHANGPARFATFDNGALYYALSGSPMVRRFDESSGQTSDFFALDPSVTGWTIENGTITYLTPTAFVVITPDGARHELVRTPNGRQFQLHDGYVYWFEPDREIRRRGVNGGPVETFPVPPTNGALEFGVVDGRLAFQNDSGLLWEPLAAGAVPMPLLPGSSEGFEGVTAEGVYVATTAPVAFPAVGAAVLRVPWTGGPPETIYQTSLCCYDATTSQQPEITLPAVVRGARTYILRAEHARFLWLTTTLIVVEDGMARERYRAPNQGLDVFLLGADDDGVVLEEPLDPLSSDVQFVRVCAHAPRARAVR
jgi:hypothetical protein